MVQVRDGVTGNPLPGVLGGFNAYVPWFTGGVQVAVADVTGDGNPSRSLRCRRPDLRAPRKEIDDVGVRPEHLEVSTKDAVAGFALSDRHCG